jgi:hypothetical protein
MEDSGKKVPRVVVAVVVYNRFRNVERWADCWKQCDTKNAELVVIHNYKGTQDRTMYQSFCKGRGITYVPRENIGFDIGAFQDVCNNRLAGFPLNFEYLLWCTDDLWPMKKDFIARYLLKFDKNVVSVCYELSKEVHPHIRTTGFMLKKETLAKIRFNVDPIITKAQCYDFEHRDPVNSLVDQLNKIGKSVQVEDIESTCMWDTGHNSREAMRRRLRRQSEHYKVFG